MNPGIFREYDRGIAGKDICEPDAIKFDVVDRIVAHYKAKPSQKVIDIDGLRAVYDDGWGLVRASNTYPALVLQFESLTRERLD